MDDNDRSNESKSIMSASLIKDYVVICDTHCMSDLTREDLNKKGLKKEENVKLSQKEGEFDTLKLLIF